jgi:diphthamide biosynthesis protein 2
MIFSCCVDEIAAQHASTNCLVHYGDACLSEPPEKLPVRYVFGKFPIDLDDYRTRLATLVKQETENSPKMCLLYDSSFSYCSSKCVYFFWFHLA